MIDALPPRTVLFVPATNGRAVAKSRTLPVDMVVLDLEDGVAPEGKEDARRAACEALAEGFDGRLSAVRINAFGSSYFAGDLAALRGCVFDGLVVPKVESGDAVRAARAGADRPVLAMIETARGVLAAPAIASEPSVAGLIAGTNDLRAALGLPDDTDRSGLVLALQAIVLAARAAGIWALDGVCNGLDATPEFARECEQGCAFGFDGKTLVHPAQIEVARHAFGDDADRIAEARALLAAFRGGAERFKGRMIEAMHVAQARGVLVRAGEPLP